MSGSARSQNQGSQAGFVTCTSCGGPVVLRASGRPRVHAYCEAHACRQAAARARQKASRAGIRQRPIDPPKPKHVSTVHRSNGDALKAAARLYIDDGDVVADLTYGSGVFWKKTAHDRFKLLGSDIRLVDGIALQADFRCLPYSDNSVDVVVLDPPYLHMAPSNRHMLDERYRNHEVTAGYSHQQILDLYGAGLKEAARVLRPKGRVLVKCMDSIESGQQRWAHISIREIAQQLGFTAIDMLVVATRARRTTRWAQQFHAHKSHSYLWVFRRPGRELRRG